MNGLPEAVARLAAADFSEVADCFANAGYQVRLPARGILQVGTPAHSGSGRSVLVSVGVHGDETAPIEMLAQLLAGLAETPHRLQVDLMVVVGNPAAIALGKRYLETDLNRLFLRERGEEGGAESQRADAIMRATDAFFAAPAQRWHLDLHTAIRASRFPTFAIVPDVHGEAGRQALLAWLGSAGIEAAVLNRQLAGTYSAYSAVHFGALGCTAELGQVSLLGQNDLRQFAATEAALLALLTGADLAQASAPQLFSVAQALIKHSDDFSFHFDPATDNFTAFAPGTDIASDGDQVYRVGEETEYVVFPNPKVALGKRAGLMVVKAA